MLKVLELIILTIFNTSFYEISYAINKKMYERKQIENLSYRICFI